MNIREIDIRDVSDLKKEISDLIILDVRTPAEFQAGALPDAINIDVMNVAPFKERVEKYRDVPIAVYCGSGGRSKLAAQTMVQVGFENIHNCTNGYGSLA